MRSGSKLRYYPGIFPEKLRKITKSVRIADSGPRYEPEISRIRYRLASHSVMTFGNMDLREMGCEDGRWIGLAQGHVQ
jgi:hypothetical protein